jgi:putative NADH-flavin reductase
MTTILSLVQMLKWSYASPSIRLHGMHTDNFIFTYTNVISSEVSKASLSKADIHTNVVSLVLHNTIITYKLAFQSTSGRSLTEIVGSTPTGGMDICLL